VQLAPEMDPALRDASVDAVVISTPTSTHYALVKAALAAGKHVLVEKPMAVTLPEAKEILALARKSPGYLVCAPHVILSNTYQTMWRRLKRGDIGKPFSARACYGWAGPDWAPWYYQRGGGSLFDLGVYNITSLTGLLGPARRIMAMAGIAIPEREVAGERIRVEADDNVHLLMDFGANVCAVVTTGFTMQKYRCAGIEVYGSEGTIQMIGEDWAPKGYELWQNSVGAWQLYENTDPTWHWSAGLRHMVECIRQQMPPLIQPEHAFHVLEIMLKAQESGCDGQAKPIVSTFSPPVFPEAADATSAHRIHDPGREE